MSQYWIGKNPGSTVTSGQAEAIAVLGRNLESTTIAATVAAGASKLSVLVSGVGSTKVAANLGRLGGTALAIPIKLSSGVGDITHFMDITQTNSSRNIVTTALASANGVVVNVANNVGFIRIKCRDTAGSALNRYILLFSS